MKIIVGLGNPGKEYEKTRHNVGFMAVDYLRDQWMGDDFSDKKEWKAQIAEARVGSEKVILVKPLTYMNLSGQALAHVMNFYKLETDDVLILYDDVDLPLEALRLKVQGSAGTHNGMKSIIQCIGTQSIPRLRIGITPEQSFKGDLSSFVLGKFTEDELAGIMGIMDDIRDACELFAKGDLVEAMNQFNGGGRS